MESKQPGVPLQEWLKNNPTSKKTDWKIPFERQIRFVESKLVPVFATGVDHELVDQTASVISTYESNSIKLPVYQLERPDIDLKVVLRSNFYDWKISVLSETPIEADFDGLFYTTPPTDKNYTEDPINPVYFEGFPRELVFPYYDQTDGRRWSAEIKNNETLWTSTFLMMRSLGKIKPLIWPTRESYKKDLGLS